MVRGPNKIDFHTYQSNIKFCQIFFHLVHLQELRSFPSSPLRFYSNGLFAGADPSMRATFPTLMGKIISVSSYSSYSLLYIRCRYSLSTLIEPHILWSIFSLEYAENSFDCFGPSVDAEQLTSQDNTAHYLWPSIIGLLQTGRFIRCILGFWNRL